MEAVGLGLRVLLLLAVANSAPILAKRLLGARWAWPIDGGLRFVDGRPLLGPSKTWRGLLVATLATSLAAPLLGFDPLAGAAAGALAMAGDACSSFVKRRLGVPSSGQAFGLDQVPEALLPLLVLRGTLALPWSVVLGVTLAFLLLETPVAWLSHRLGLRDRPW
jgi:CDP-2,3-bis-(O-geranylgeranyl)-sn-glycerol synthase